MKRPAAAVLAVLAVLAVGCPSEPVDDGTAVGNPSVTTMAIAGGDGFTIDSATATIASIRYTSCDRSESADTLDREVDLLGDAVELRPGTFCALLVDFGGPVRVSAEWSDGGDPASLDLTLAPGTLGLAPEGGSVRLDDDVLVLELAAPDWLDAEALGLVAGEDLVVGEESAEHDALAGAIEEDSTLFQDVGADGVVAAEDRERPVARIGEPTFAPDATAGLQSDAEGCTCATASPRSPGWALIALLALSVRRRRGGAAPPR